MLLLFFTPGSPGVKDFPPGKCQAEWIFLTIIAGTVQSNRYSSSVFWYRAALKWFSLGWIHRCHPIVIEFSTIGAPGVPCRIFRALSGLPRQQEIRRRCLWRSRVPFIISGMGSQTNIWHVRAGVFCPPNSLVLPEYSTLWLSRHTLEIQYFYISILPCWKRVLISNPIMGILVIFQRTFGTKHNRILLRSKEIQIIGKNELVAWNQVYQSKGMTFIQNNQINRNEMHSSSVTVNTKNWKGWIYWVKSDIPIKMYDVYPKKSITLINQMTDENNWIVPHSRNLYVAFVP